MTGYRRPFLPSAIPRALSVHAGAVLLAGCLLAAAVSLLPKSADAADDIPLSVHIVLHKAQTLMKENRVQEAIALLTEADVPEGRRHYLISFLLGNGYLTTGRPEMAQRHFSATVTRKPDFHSGWINLAKSQYDAGAFAPAAEAFVQAYRTGSEPDPTLLYYAGVSLMTAEDYPGALAVFQRLQREHPSSIRLQWREAMVQTDLVLDRPRQALEHLQILADQSEGERRTQWREMLLYHYLSLGENERAMDLVQRLTREAPLEAKWWKGQVHLFLEEAKTRDALTALAVRGLIIRLDRRETELLGDLYLSEGIPRKAAIVYQRALSEAFRIETARKLVEAYRRQHRPEAALEWAEQSLKRYPGDGSLMLAKADLLYEQRRWKAAAAAYRKALPHTDANGRLWWLMGHCAAASRDWKEARTSWEKAMEFEAYRRRAGDALKRLDLWERSADRTDTE